jgi:predicted dehydrogenase
MLRHLLICGLGSIGRRHLRHFRALGVPRIDAYRTGLATLPEQGQPAPDRVFKDLEQALADRPDAVVVANPTSLHLATATAAVRAGADVLIEKPLGDRLEGVPALRDEAAARGRIVAVAHNLRYHPMLREIRGWTRDGGPFGSALIARIKFGAYLPAWHPWEDYRRAYAARRELGGGVALTSIHEIDYALWLFGPPERALALPCGRRPLGTGVEEAAGFLIRHASGVLTTVSLSFFERISTREIEIAFENATVRADLLSGEILILRPDGSSERRGSGEPFDFDQTYRRQAEAFLSAVERRCAAQTSLDEAAAALRIALLVQGACDE